MQAPAFDGTWVDAATIVTALAVVIVKAVIRKIRHSERWLTARESGVDFLNGAVIVPFVALALAPFAPNGFTSLQQANPVMISIAGIIGLFFVTEELRQLSKPA